MDKIIDIDIFGMETAQIKSGCSACGDHHEKGGCGGGCCKSSSSCGGGCNKAEGNLILSLKDAFEDLDSFIKNSDVSHLVELKFFDLEKVNVLDFDDIRILTEMDYEPPFIVIDGIVRYYGGISKELIYKDIKDLIE